MFERYTENARKTVFMARYEASQSASAFIQTEHLLLGVFRVDPELALRLLCTREKLEVVRSEVEKRHPVVEGARSVDLPLSGEARRVLAIANKEAERRRQHHIGCEHLLLGLFLDEKSAAAEILREQGVTREMLEAEAQRSAGDAAAPPATRQTGFAGRIGEAVKSAISRSPAVDVSEPNPAALGLRNLSEAARHGHLRGLIGREREVDRTIQVLARKIRNSALLVGEAGVGKTAIVHGIAQRVVDQRVPALLADRPVYGIDASSLIAPSRRAKAEATDRGVLALLAEEPIGILCINGLLDVAASPGWGAVEAAHVMEVLSRSGIQCVATGSPAGLRRSLENAGVLVRHFEVVEVAPATEDDAVAVLEGLKQEYEAFHSVTYDEGVVEAAVFASGRFLPHRFLPDRAVDLLDDAGARAHVKGQATVTKEDLEASIAERAGVSIEAVRQVLAQKKGKEPQLAAEKLAEAVPRDQREWLPFLAAYVAGSSKADVERLADAMRELKAE